MIACSAISWVSIGAGEGAPPEIAVWRGCFRRGSGSVGGRFCESHSRSKPLTHGAALVVYHPAHSQLTTTQRRKFEMKREFR